MCTTIPYYKTPDELSFWKVLHNGEVCCNKRCDYKNVTCFENKIAVYSGEKTLEKFSNIKKFFSYKLSIEQWDLDLYRAIANWMNLGKKDKKKLVDDSSVDRDIKEIVQANLRNLKKVYDLKSDEYEKITNIDNVKVMLEGNSVSRRTQGNVKFFKEMLFWLKQFFAN